MAVGVTAFWELEIEAEGLALAVDEASHFASFAECRFSIVESFFAAFRHVLVGPVEADDAQGLF